MIKIEDFRKFEKNTLRGFARIRLEPTGIIIDGVTVHEKGGRRWIGLPAKPYQDEDGNQKWSPIVRIEPRKQWENFQAQALKALEGHINSFDPPMEISQDDIPF